MLARKQEQKMLWVILRGKIICSKIKSDVKKIDPGRQDPGSQDFCFIILVPLSIKILRTRHKAGFCQKEF